MANSNVVADLAATWAEARWQTSEKNAPARFGRKRHVVYLVLFAIAISGFLAPATSSAVTNTELRTQIQELERRLQDYPELASVIGPRLKQKRLELMAQLQSDVDYLNTVKGSLTGSDKAAAQAQIKSLAEEIASLQKAVSANGSSQPAVAARGNSPSSTAKAQADTSGTSQSDSPNGVAANPSVAGSSPQNTAPSQAASTTSAPASAGAQADAAPLTSNAKPAGEPALPKLPEPVFAPAIQPSSVKLVVDISRDWQSTNFEKGCSNKPADQTSDNWQIRIAAVPLWPGTDKPVDAFPPNGNPLQNNLYIYVLTQNEGAAAPTIAVGAQRYAGHLQAYARKVDLSFDHLTLSHAADLVQQLTTDIGPVQRVFSSGQVSLKVYQLAASASSPLKDTSDIYSALTCSLSPQGLRKLLSDVGADYEETLNPAACFLPPMKIRIRPVKLTSDPMQTLTLDSDSIEKTRAGLKAIADNEKVSFSSNPELAKNAVAQGDPPSAVSKGNVDVTDARRELILIDNPCFHVSVDPLLSGSEITPAVNFRYDYNYFSEGNAVIARLHAEGEGADTSHYFQRIQGYGNLTTLLGSPGGWQFYGGAVATVSGTKDPDGMGASQWTGGGQFQIQAPVLTPFNVLSGANSRPTLSVAVGAAGGDATTTGATNLLVNGAFVYTFRPTYQLSVDLKASGGWSNQPRFANNQGYGYFSFIGRYNIKGDWDFLGKYECGRKDPDYRKFCGWQTGFTFLTGR